MRPGREVQGDGLAHGLDADVVVYGRAHWDIVLREVRHCLEHPAQGFIGGKRRILQRGHLFLQFAGTQAGLGDIAAAALQPRKLL